MNADVDKAILEVRGDLLDKAIERAEKAEALLRECLTVMELHPATHPRITAHLSENSHD